MRLLAVEDHKDIGIFLKAGLTREGFIVDLASDGREALALAEEKVYDVILMDIVMPGMDGLTVVKTLRKTGFRGAILMITSKGEELDKIQGLDVGADDYVVKPFRLKEVAARIRAVLRRTAPVKESGAHGASLRAGNIQMDLLRREVTRGGKRIDLTKKEFELLEYLLRHPGEVMSQTVLAQRISENASANDANLVEFHIKNLRAKLDPKSGPSLIRTVRGCGYALDV